MHSLHGHFFGPMFRPLEGAGGQLWRHHPDDPRFPLGSALYVHAKLLLGWAHRLIIALARVTVASCLPDMSFLRKKTTNIAFVKTHKTASTTLASILYRYARWHNVEVRAVSLARSVSLSPGESTGCRYACVAAVAGQRLSRHHPLPRSSSAAVLEQRSIDTWACTAYRDLSLVLEGSNISFSCRRWCSCTEL